MTDSSNTDDNVGGRFYIRYRGATVAAIVTALQSRSARRSCRSMNRTVVGQHASYTAETRPESHRVSSADPSTGPDTPRGGSMQIAQGAAALVASYVEAVGTVGC